MGGGESNAMRVAILDQVNGLYLGDGMPVLLYLQCQACSFAAPAAEAGNLLLIIAHLIQHQRAKFLQDAEEAACAGATVVPPARIPLVRATSGVSHWQVTYITTGSVAGLPSDCTIQ